MVSLLHALSKYGAGTRSFVKALLRSITGKCELERLSLSGKYGYNECQEIEYSLYNSKNPDIRRILVADKMKVKDAMQTILRVKRIIPDQDLFFLSSMPKYLRKILTYNTVLSYVNELHSIQYDSQNPEHEEILMQLWTLIKGEDDKIDERITSRWTEIGFQGKNPATDFRGMGVLGLKNLIYLFEKDSKVGMKIYGQSLHPNYGFSFAIMAINFTSTSFQLLRNGKLKGYMYGLEDEEYTFGHFQDFFLKIFDEFADYWIMRKPPNIMSFNEIKEAFMIDVYKRLSLGKW